MPNVVGFRLACFQAGRDFRRFLKPRTGGLPVVATRVGGMVLSLWRWGRRYLGAPKDPFAVPAPGAYVSQPAGWRSKWGRRRRAGSVSVLMNGELDLYRPCRVFQRLAGQAWNKVRELYFDIGATDARSNSRSRLTLLTA